MFDVGWSELLVIGVVALIVVGPKDLPVMFNRLGQFTAKARGMAREFQRAMEDAAKEAGVKDVSRDLREIASPARLGLDKLRDVTRDLTSVDARKGAATQESVEDRAARSARIREATDKAAAERKASEAVRLAEAKPDPMLVAETAPRKPAVTAAPEPLAGEAPAPLQAATPDPSPAPAARTTAPQTIPATEKKAAPKRGPAPAAGTPAPEPAVAKEKKAAPKRSERGTESVPEAAPAKAGAKARPKKAAADGTAEVGPKPRAAKKAPGTDAVPPAAKADE